MGAMTSLNLSHHQVCSCSNFGSVISRPSRLEHSKICGCQDVGSGHCEGNLTSISGVDMATRAMHVGGEDVCGIFAIWHHKVSNFTSLGGAVPFPMTLLPCWAL